jgi:type II secretory pathway pseudopilin PulG
MSINASRSQQGFTYLALLFAITLLGAGMALTGEVWHTAAQREREQQLLFVGNELRTAIGRYYERTPGPAKQFPRSLDLLLEDARQAVPQRYLRRIYFDPMTSSADWGLVMRGDAVIGVYSRSSAVPMKSARFSQEDAGFEEAATYSDWKFVYKPKSGTASGISRHILPPTRIEK